MTIEKLIPASLTNLIDKVKEHFPEDKKLQEMFEQCFINTEGFHADMPEKFTREWFS